MRLNHVGYSAKLKLFLGVLLAACFLATAAHADSLFTGTFELKNEVHWGNAVLGPGTYSLTLDQPARSVPIVIIRDISTGKIVARAIASGPDYTLDRGDSKVLVAVHGNRRAVYSVRLAGIGEVFQLAHPFGTGEGAAQEARNAEAISVQIAKK
jgi:hypothetical protein